MPPAEASIEYQHISLQPATPDHLNGWKHFMQDPEVMTHIFGGWNPDDDELGRLLTANVRNWDRYRMGWWSVFEADELIANCVLDVSCSGASEVGYIIRRESWRQGFGTLIVKSLCRYAFETEEIDALKAYVNVDNTGSIKLLEGLGFTRDSEVSFSGRACLNYGMKRCDYRGE